MIKATLIALAFAVVGAAALPSQDFWNSVELQASATRASNGPSSCNETVSVRMQGRCEIPAVYSSANSMYTVTIRRVDVTPNNVQFQMRATGESMFTGFDINRSGVGFGVFNLTAEGPEDCSARIAQNNLAIPCVRTPGIYNVFQTTWEDLGPYCG